MFLGIEINIVYIYIAEAFKKNIFNLLKHFKRIFSILL